MGLKEAEWGVVKRYISFRPGIDAIHLELGNEPLCSIKCREFLD